jgi:hypothetical protein
MPAKLSIGDCGWRLKALSVEEVVRDVESLRTVQASQANPLQEQIDKFNHVRDHATLLYQHAFDGVVDDLSRHANLEFARHKSQDESGVAALFLLLGDDFDDSFASAMQQAGTKAYAYAERALGKSDWGNLKERSEEFGKLRAPDLTNAPKEVIEKLRADVLRGLAEKQSPAALARRVTEAARAAKGTVGSRVAETEATITLGTAMDSVFSALGYTMKRWVSQRDDAVRDTHEACDKQGWLPIGATFTNGLKYPGQADAPLSEICNCRCFLIGKVGK